MLVRRGQVRSGATFSLCRRWRYSLWRTWDETCAPVVFIGLNPSTADETQDDPTIRRCIGFARAWGGGGVVMVNIFAWRSTDPAELYKVQDNIVGPGNDNAILRNACAARFVVAAWGVHGKLHERGEIVRGLLSEAGVTLHRLGTTKAGHPRHPLYMRGDAVPKVWPC